MKDKNGKTLREGDVCIVHPVGLFAALIFGEIVEVDCVFGDGDVFVRYDDSVCNGFVSRAVLKNSELEIIGDVR